MLVDGCGLEDDLGEVPGLVILGGVQLVLVLLGLSLLGVETDGFLC